MSCLNFGQKLVPAKKTWKGFKSTLERKMHKLKRSKSIKKTRNRLNTTFSSLLNHSKSLPPLCPRRIKRPLTELPSAIRHHHHKLQQSFKPVYVDELFSEPFSGPETREKKVVDRKTMPENSKVGGKATKSGAVDKWKISEFAFPQLRGVDERADEFIALFREDMRLQREKSLGTGRVDESSDPVSLSADTDPV